LARSRERAGRLARYMKTERVRRAKEKRNPEATREALLDAGRELFAERGFDGVSIDEVAHRAGVNKALISYHFGGKCALHVAVLERGFGDVAGRLVRAEQSAGSAREALEAIVAEFTGFAEAHSAFPAMYLREFLSSGVDPSVAPHLMLIVGVSRRILERGVREGVFLPVHPLSFHFALVGALAFFFATEPVRRVFGARFAPKSPQPKAAEFARYLIDLTMRGLAPAPAAKRRKGVRS
jgi:AcrR family transcriptional regulator